MAPCTMVHPSKGESQLTSAVGRHTFFFLILSLQRSIRCFAHTHTHTHTHTHSIQSINQSVKLHTANTCHWKCVVTAGPVLHSQGRITFDRLMSGERNRARERARQRGRGRGRGRGRRREREREGEGEGEREKTTGEIVVLLFRLLLSGKRNLAPQKKKHRNNQCL